MRLKIFLSKIIPFPHLYIWSHMYFSWNIILHKWNCVLVLHVGILWMLEKLITKPWQMHWQCLLWTTCRHTSDPKGDAAVNYFLLTWEVSHYSKEKAYSMWKVLHDLMSLIAHKIHFEVIYRFLSPSHRSGSHHWAAAQQSFSLTHPNFDLAREKALCRKETRERTSEKLSCSILGNYLFDYLAQLLAVFVQNSERFYISFAAFASWFPMASVVQQL